MKIYFDSGVFIDFLIGRGHTQHFLRATDRRGRSPERLSADAESCLSSVSRHHLGITSSLTCYEVEEALYKELRRGAAGVPNADRFIIPAARAVITQTLVTIDLFGISMVDLTSAVVAAQCGNLELQKRGIRAADALHITTALSNGADLFISSDSVLIELDGILQSMTGLPLRFADTDRALTLLS